MSLTLKRNARLPVALSMAASAWLPMSAVAQEAKPAADRPLLFVSNREGKMKFNIYSMKPDGSDVKNLSKSDTVELDPALSPDGKQIAYVAMKTGGAPEGGVYVMNVDGSERRRLTDFKGMAISPVWSPDSKRIAFSSFPFNPAAPEPPKFTIQVMETDGKNKKEIGEGLISDWSRDGKILSARMEGGDFSPRLYLMNADGSSAKKLLDIKAMSGVFSPDGKHIAFIAESDGGNQPDVFVMNADGTEKKQLTKTEDIEFSPQWSLDGKHLFFTRFPKDNPGDPLTSKIEIYRVDLDGKNEKAITRNAGANLLSGSAMFMVFATQAQVASPEPEETIKKEKP